METLDDLFDYLKEAPTEERRQIICRAEAKALGLKRYFTGEPCMYDHIAERHTLNGMCIPCGNLKTKLYNRRKYAQRPAKTKACVICGKEFVARNGAIACSKQHREERKKLTDVQYREEHREEFREKNRVKVPRIKHCTVCGKGFVAQGTKRTCSEECRDEHLVKYWADWHRKEYAARSDADRALRNEKRQKWREERRRTKNCVICGKEFYPQGNDLTCSEEHGEELKTATMQEWRADNAEHLKAYNINRNIEEQAALEVWLEMGLTITSREDERRLIHQALNKLPALKPKSKGN